jgi:hypothetical protein
MERGFWKSGAVRRIDRCDARPFTMPNTITMERIDLDDECNACILDGDNFVGENVFWLLLTNRMNCC